MNTILLLTILLINVIYLNKLYDVIHSKNQTLINNLIEYNEFLLNKIVELEEDWDDEIEY